MGDSLILKDFLNFYGIEKVIFKWFDLSLLRFLVLEEGLLSQRVQSMAERQVKTQLKLGCRVLK